MCQYLLYNQASPSRAYQTIIFFCYNFLKLLHALFIFLFCQKMFIGQIHLHLLRRSNLIFHQVWISEQSTETNQPTVYVTRGRDDIKCKTLDVNFEWISRR